MLVGQPSGENEGRGDGQAATRGDVPPVAAVERPVVCFRLGADAVERSLGIPLPLHLGSQPRRPSVQDDSRPVTLGQAPGHSGMNVERIVPIELELECGPAAWPDRRANRRPGSPLRHGPVGPHEATRGARCRELAHQPCGQPNQHQVQRPANHLEGKLDHVHPVRRVLGRWPLECITNRIRLRRGDRTTARRVLSHRRIRRFPGRLLAKCDER
jgi:hypothetical protein